MISDPATTFVPAAALFPTINALPHATPPPIDVVILLSHLTI